MEQSISSDLIRGHIDTIILHTLLDGDKFAEQISETVEKKSENAYKINQATLYSALKRLQNIKLLNSYQRDIDNGGRRKFFTLTDKGRETVEQNLSSWSYSRAIIDKLIDCEPQPIYKTEYVEKIVQIPVEKIVEVPVEKVVYKNDIPQEKKENDSPIQSYVQKDEPLQPTQTETQPKRQETIQEINFRNIINGLIKTCVVTDEKNEEVVEIGAITRDDVVKDEEIQKFNDTITTENARPIKRQELETIDFSDLMIKSAEEGYKLRVSNKNSALGSGTLLINKCNLITALAMFLLFIVEFLVLSITYGKLLNITLPLSLGLICVMAIYPIVCLVKYLKNQLLVVKKNVSKDTILTSAIIVFNLLLINFACLLLFDFDFSIKKDLIVCLIIPIIIYLDILIYSILRYVFAHHKLCKITQK